MNKVLVVDDEKLVRQGIISTFPWRKHGFEVVADAGSGEKALELLAAENIDLLVTDLAMNGMSGLELIKQVKMTRQDMPVVILTCHDNFKYIQEAMRLGVLDYIVKTEIEDEIVDETLTRIAGKLKAAKNRRAESGTPHSLRETAREGLLLCGPTRASVPLELLSREVPEDWVGRLAEVDSATWLLRLSGEETSRLLERISPRLGTESWTCVRIAGMDGEDEQVLSALKRYRRRHLFYHPPKPLAEVSWNEIRGMRMPDGDATAGLSPEWKGPAWVYDDGKFESLLHLTADTGIGAAELRMLFYPVALEWERLLDTGALNELLDLADGLLYWRDWDHWLRGFRRAIRQTVDKNATRQIGDSILQAVERIRTAHDPEMSESDIARSVNMSRGHFSKSFKKVTGKSYGDYVRLLKLERAKETILRTDEPITRVAELCGFNDYRHFSRVFREYTGMLPNEYRKTHGI